MIGDTIVAVATAAGASERAVVRLSGPAAFDVAARVFEPTLVPQRAQVPGRLRVHDASFDAIALTMVAPHSFTGEHTVELHVPGSPVLLRLLQQALLDDGATSAVRAAEPGEFTARACRHGRLDLVQAEGLLLLLHAADRQQAEAGVQWLRGGLADDVQRLRRELQDRLALVEVGLDFDEQDTGAVAPSAWRDGLPAIAEELERLLARLPSAAPGGELLLVGRANVGKSTLANALAGRDTALVADHPGTTRDLLRVPVVDGSSDPATAVHLWDAPGDLDEPGEADRAALALRERLAGRAAGLLVVLDATEPVVPPFARRAAQPWFGVVYTRCDLLRQRTAPLPALDEDARARLSGPDRIFATGLPPGAGAAGEGVEALRRALLAAASGGGCGGVDAGGPLHQALSACRRAVVRARQAADLAPELAAVELQAALRALDGTAGSHDPEQLLDRIYGRFCLGK